MLQTTIKHPISCYGIGVHSGRNVQLTLKPARQNTGIVFIRTDVTKFNNVIYAGFDQVSETTLSTTVSNEDKVSVSTIEHLLAAIYGSGLDNVIIELDGPEIPIMDGSSQPFLFMIECASLIKLSAKKKMLKINKDIELFGDNGSYVLATASDNFDIDITIDFSSKIIGTQKTSFTVTNNAFVKEIAAARTFGFVKDLEYLQSKGLAKGASLDNAIGIDDDKILNHDGLRFNDEFVRHKLLDAIGDFTVASTNIYGSFKFNKSGHYLNNQFLHKLFSDTQNYSWI